MQKLTKNKEGGFIQLIILIIIALFVMRYYGITISGVYYWLKSLVLSVW